MVFLGTFSSLDFFHQIPVGELLEKPEVGHLNELGRRNDSRDIQGQNRALSVNFLAIPGKVATFGQLFRCLPLVASPWKSQRLAIGIKRTDPVVPE